LVIYADGQPAAAATLFGPGMTSNDAIDPKDPHFQYCDEHTSEEQRKWFAEVGRRRMKETYSGAEKLTKLNSACFLGKYANLELDGWCRFRPRP
jgi:hypothetical protein